MSVSGVCCDVDALGGWDQLSKHQKLEAPTPARSRWLERTRSTLRKDSRLLQTGSEFISQTIPPSPTNFIA